MATLPAYSYKTLDLGCIRVLRLHPGSSGSPLVCDIITQPIGGKPYDALSYVWGDPTPAAWVKCIDEKHEGELDIGKGLAGALTAFRFTDKPRCIWIDALCINQKDVTERQSQVRIMGAIYGKAEQVLCWLGPFSKGREKEAELKARFAIRFLRSFNENPREHLREARQHFHSGDEMTDMKDPFFGSWLAIKELFDLEYFHQVGLARQARFFWGVQDIWLDWTEVAAFCRFMDDNGASVITHLQLNSWVANHINLVWENDTAGKPIYNFVEVLHWARVHRSTDPRDYINALLSHPSATVNGSLLVQPNYTITPTQAYIQLALNVIERTHSLQILAYVDHHETPSVLNLPSWVPDWHALNLVAPLRCPTSAATDTDSLISVVECKKGMVLKCRGFLIDNLRTISDMIEPSELVISTQQKERQKKIPFLIDHIWRNNVEEIGIPLDSPGEFLASLGLVLTGGHLNDSDSTSGATQEQQQSDFAALVLEYERIREHDDLHGFFASLLPKEKALVQAMALGGSAHQFVQDMTWTSMCRKVFRTAKGHFGLGPRIMRQGDYCVVMLGAKYPMILRTGSGGFQLVGPALLYGFMNGEAERLCRNGMLSEQAFEII